MNLVSHSQFSNVYMNREVQEQLATILAEKLCCMIRFYTSIFRDCFHVEQETKP